MAQGFIDTSTGTQYGRVKVISREVAMKYIVHRLAESYSNAEISLFDYAG